MAAVTCGSCGKKTMRPVTRDVDVSAMVGLRPRSVTVMDAQVNGCSWCKDFTFDGALLEACMDRLTVELVGVDRLTGDEARYLRKHMLLTQTELAVRLGYTRASVARWEGEKHVDHVHSFVLRAMVYAWLLGLIGTHLPRIDGTEVLPPVWRFVRGPLGPRKWQFEASFLITGRTRS